MTVPVFPICRLKELSEAVSRTYHLEMITQKSWSDVNVNRFQCIYLTNTNGLWVCWSITKNKLEIFDMLCLFSFKQPHLLCQWLTVRFGSCMLIISFQDPRYIICFLWFQKDFVKTLNRILSQTSQIHPCLTAVGKKGVQAESIVCSEISNFISQITRNDSTLICHLNPLQAYFLPDDGRWEELPKLLVLCRSLLKHILIAADLDTSFFL